jgi:hypothetical protein
VSLRHPHPQGEAKDIELDVGINELVGQQVEAQPQLEEQLVLPLLHQATWRDDQALPDIVAELACHAPGTDRPGPQVRAGSG